MDRLKDLEGKQDMRREQIATVRHLLTDIHPNVAQVSGWRALQHPKDQGEAAGLSVR